MFSIVCSVFSYNAIVYSQPFLGNTVFPPLASLKEPTMLEKEKNLSPKDLKLFNIVDTPKQAVAIIDKFYNKYTLKPNF